MKKRIMTLLCMILCIMTTCMADTYSVDNLPMVYLQDRTKHVVNPDGLLSQHTVMQMDTLLYRLEQEKGIQSVVAVVENIEGGDCYEFAITLGNKYGVGNKNNTGLIILLSTKDRCYQILTGEGLEGTLPDAICRRIENRMMVPHLKTGDWDSAMLKTVMAVYEVASSDDGLSPLKENKGGDDDSLPFALIIMGVIFVFIFISWRSNRKHNSCPKCGNYPLQRVNSEIKVDRINGIEHHKTILKCPKCGHICTKNHDEPWDNGTGFGAIPPVVGPFHRGFGSHGGGGGFSGGDFGGGSFGGGGSGGEF